MLRRYLLGQLSEAEAETVELRLLSEDDYLEEMEIVENDLLDEYLHGALNEVERSQMESRFLRAPERSRKLGFAAALSEEMSSRAAGGANVADFAPRPSAQSRRFFSPPYFKVAAAVLITVSAAFCLWWLFAARWEVRRGMAALNEAYKNQRLTEARISGLNYAPAIRLRGGARPAVDTASLDRAERLLKEAADEDKGPASLHALGRFYLAGGEFDKAEEQFEKALAKDQNDAQLHSDAGAALLEMGDAARKDDAGRGLLYFARSLEHLDRALELNGSLPEALFNRALLYQRMMLPQAKDAWLKYLEKDSTSPWADEARRNLASLEQQGAKAARDKGRLYEDFLAAYRAGDADAAWLAITRSRSRSGNHVVEQLIDEHLDLSERRQAEQAAERLRMLSFAGKVEAEKAGDRYTADLADFYARAGEGQRRRLAAARRQSALAGERYDRSEFEEAGALYAEAARQFNSAGDMCEALFAESWVGYCGLRLADKLSEQRFERLSNVYEEKGYKSLLAQSLHAISDAATSTDDLSKALDYAGRSLKLSESIRDDATKLRCLQQFVSMHVKFGNYAEALRYGLNAIEMAPEFASDPKLIWPFYQQLALDFYWLKLYAAALEFEKEALRLAEESNWPFILSRSYTQLGLIYEQRREYGAAVQSGVRAVAEARNVEGEKSRLNILSPALMRLGHLYRQSGDFADALSNYDDALRMFESLNLNIFLYEAHKGKFQTLAATGDDGAAARELSEALRLFEQYRPKIQEEHNRDSFFDAGQDIYDLAIDFAYAKQNDPAQAFEYAEASRARSLLNLLRTTPQVIDKGEGPDLNNTSLTSSQSLSEIRDRLPEGAQIVEYALLGDKLIIWVITRSGVESRTVAVSGDELARKVADYVRRVAGTDGAAPETRAAAEELYSTLIAPVEPLLAEDGEVCIVPDKALSNLPFGALVSPSAGKFFIEKYRFVVSPSSNVFVACTEAARDEAGTHDERLLSVGDPSFSGKSFPNLSPLPESGREAEQIAALYESTAPLVGEKADEGRVRAEMPDAEVVHLASHYVVDERSPMLSGLLLAAPDREAAARHESDGVLQSYEVYEMKLPCTRLVVLSACRTGVERSYQGEGAIGIARSFIAAGVPLVVASLWPVESDSTAELMIRFHRYRKLAGLSSAEALRRAQLDMLGGPDRRNRSPHAWAAFVVFGGHAPF